MRNAWRVLVFDILAPLAVLASLVYIGLALERPLWWVVVGTIVGLLVLQASVVNFVLFRRDGVTMGTDDDAPRLRLAVVGLTAVAVVAAAIVGYTKWTVPDRTTSADMSMVVGIASSVAEASATFTPGAPNVSIDRATALMAPQRAEAYRNEFNAVAKDLTSRGVAGQASTISAGVETIGPNFASVAVVMRATQNTPNKPAQATVLGLRVTLTKQDGRWLVMDVTPIASR
ncbi:putative transmembrane protein [Mycobacteroides abscessus subsp. abscessus]|nr:putative transmembrane protein [Mycobacteroides abscessus subsp. abscessus]